MKITLEEVVRIVRGVVRGGCDGCTQRFSGMNRPKFWVELVKHISRSGDMSFYIRFHKNILDAKKLEAIEHLLERHGVEFDDSTLENVLVSSGMDNDAMALEIAVMIQEMFSEALGLSLKDIVRSTIKGGIDVRRKTQEGLRDNNGQR